MKKGTKKTNGFKALGSGTKYDRDMKKLARKAARKEGKYYV